MAKLITIPNFSQELNSSEKITPLTKIIWHKRINDFIKKDEIICSIETDKATLELESIYEGFLLFQNKETLVNYSDVLCVIGEKNQPYDQVIDHYQKNRIPEHTQQTPFIIENTFEILFDDQKKLEENSFSWLKKLFK